MSNIPAYKFPNVTARKTAKINQLQDDLVFDQMVVATATSAVNAATVKEQLFQDLLADAQVRLQLVTSQVTMASQAAQNLDTLKQITKQSKATSDETEKFTNELLADVQAVVASTLEATSEIINMSNLVTAKKASNPLISSELVTRASDAATEASTVVSLIINTLTSTYNALSASKQACRTIDIVEKELCCMWPTLMEKADKDCKNFKASDAEESIQKLLNARYKGAIKAEQRMQSAYNQAKDERIEANSNLAIATARLAQTQAALTAAQAAVGSN